MEINNLIINIITFGYHDAYRNVEKLRKKLYDFSGKSISNIPCDETNIHGYSAILESYFKDIYTSIVFSGCSHYLPRRLISSLKVFPQKISIESKKLHQQEILSNSKKLILQAKARNYKKELDSLLLNYFSKSNINIILGSILERRLKWRI